MATPVAKVKAKGLNALADALREAKQAQEMAKAEYNAYREAFLELAQDQGYLSNGGSVEISGVKLTRKHRFNADKISDKIARLRDTAKREKWEARFKKICPPKPTFNSTVARAEGCYEELVDWMDKDVGYWELRV